MAVSPGARRAGPGSSPPPSWPADSSYGPGCILWASGSHAATTPAGRWAPGSLSLIALRYRSQLEPCLSASTWSRCSPLASPSTPTAPLAGRGWSSCGPGRRWLRQRSTGARGRSWSARVLSPSWGRRRWRLAGPWCRWPTGGRTQGKAEAGGKSDPFLSGTVAT